MEFDVVIIDEATQALEAVRLCLHIFPGDAFCSLPDVTDSWIAGLLDSSFEREETHTRW